MKPSVSELRPSGLHDSQAKLWLACATGFLGACLGSCAVMLWLVRHYEVLVSWPFAMLFMGIGVMLSWFALQQWRQLHPVRCAAAVGLCSGIAGSGACLLAVYALVLVVTP